MSQFRDWADLPADLVRCIGHGLDDLKCYAGARGACTAWRRALAPPSPSLLLVLEDGGRSRFSPVAVSLPTRRCFDLQPVPWARSRAFHSLFVRPGHVNRRAHSGQRFVGSGNGWLALDFCSIYDREFIYILFNPVTAAEIFLPPLVYGNKEASLFSKLVFAPNPAQDDFAAAAICDRDRVAYVTAGARRWAVLDPIHLLSGTDRLADLVYHGEGTVYCLTLQGVVHVLHLPARRRRKPIILVYPDAQARQLNKILEVLPGSVGPDLNARASVEPLVAREGGSLPFDPSTSFSPAYNAMLDFTAAKNLVFCGDTLYQIWRNSSCTVNLRLPDGGRRRVQENEVFVLRYYPDRQPCWDAVTDLGGYAVFVGRNNAVSMYAEDVPGLKGNCVYWIGGSGRDRCMVFDMETGMSTPYLPLPAVPPQSKICCWYFLSK